MKQITIVRYWLTTVILCLVLCVGEMIFLNPVGSHWAVFIAFCTAASATIAMIWVDAGKDRS